MTLGVIQLAVARGVKLTLIRMETQPIHMFMAESLDRLGEVEQARYHIRRSVEDAFAIYRAARAREDVGTEGHPRFMPMEHAFEHLSGAMSRLGEFRLRRREASKAIAFNRALTLCVRVANAPSATLRDQENVAVAHRGLMEAYRPKVRGTRPHSTPSSHGKY